MPDLPALNPYYNRPSGYWPWVESCPVGGSDKYIQWWQVLFLLLFLTHIDCLCHHSFVCPATIIKFLLFWSICSTSSLVHWKNCPKVFTKGDNPDVYFFNGISATELGFDKFFLFVWDSLLWFSFCLRLFDDVCFQYSKLFVISLFSSVLILSWFCSSISFVVCLFPSFIMNMAYFSISSPIPVFWLHISVVCIGIQFYFS